MSKKILFTILQYVIFLGLGIGLIYWQANQFTPQQRTEVYDAINKVRDRIWLIIPVIIVGFLSHLFRALRWKLLLEPLNLRPSTVNITCAVMVGYIANLLLPRMGEVARCTVLARYEHEPVDKIIGTIVTERGFDLLCLILIAILTVAVQSDLIMGYMQEQLSGIGNKSSLILLVLGIGVLLVFAMVFIYKRNKHTKVGKFIGGIGEGVRSIMKMKKRGLFLIYTFLIWFCYLGLIYIGFKGLPPTEHLGFSAALSVLVLGSVGMIVTPGGLGAYPPIIKKTLMTLYGINFAYALAFGWICWLAQTGIIVVLGLLALLILPYYNTKPHGQNTVDTE